MELLGRGLGSGVGMLGGQGGSAQGRCLGMLRGRRLSPGWESAVLGRGTAWRKGCSVPGDGRDLAGVGLDGKSAGMGRECWSGKSVGGDYRTWNGAWQSDEVRVSWAGLWDTQGSVPGPEEGWETP